MHKGKVGIIALTVNDRARTMVLEGIKTEDRPTAVGYFILDTLRSLFLSGVRATDPIRLRVGLVDPAELAQTEGRVPIFIAPSSVEDLGPLYKLTLAVSRGEYPREEE